MTTSPAFDGPCRIRRDELYAAKQLSNICFNFGILPDDVGRDASSDSAPSREAGETYIVAADGRPVSQVRTFHERIHAYDALIRVGSIGAVCTHPDYRGHGLATQLMELCTRKLIEGGARLMLISGGRGLYTRLGFVPVGRCAHLSLRPGQVHAPAGDVLLRPITNENADAAALACSRLYACEPVRFRRTLEHARNHLRYDPPGYHRERWMVELDGRPEAYLLLTTSWQDARRPEATQRGLNEYAGSRVALAAGLAAAVQQPGIEVLDAGIPWQDTDLIRLLGEVTGPPSWTPLRGHTMRIIDFPGLLADLRPYVRSRLGPELRRGLRFEQSGPLLGAEGGDRCAIVRGEDRLELSVAQMTALVMGAPAALPDPVTLSGAKPVTLTEAQSVTLTEAQSVTLTEAQSVTLTEAQSVTPTEAQSVALTEAQSVALTEAKSVTPTEAQSVALTEAQSVTPTEAQSVILSEAKNLPSGALAEIIPALFPLPSFLPGLNYH